LLRHTARSGGQLARLVVHAAPRSCAHQHREALRPDVTADEQQRINQVAPEERAERLAARRVLRRRLPSDSVHGTGGGADTGAERRRGALCGSARAVLLRAARAARCAERSPPCDKLRRLPRAQLDS